MPFHYEVIERVIVHYKDIIKQDVDCTIYLDVDTRAMFQFKEYLTSKHPAVVWGVAEAPQYCIDVTLYPSEYESIRHLDKSRFFFISHRFEAGDQPPNVYYLAPFAPMDRVFGKIVLPFQGHPRTRTKRPVLVVQGGLNARHRDMTLLNLILRDPPSYPYTILLLGTRLEDRRLVDHPNLVVKEGLPFLDFHRHFVHAHAILPLVSRQTHPQYYTKQLTSSVQYARAYNLQCILDRELQDIYQLPDVIVYSSPTGIAQAVRASVAAFYGK